VFFSEHSVTEMLSKLVGNRAAISTALDFHTFIDSFEFRSSVVPELETIFSYAAVSRVDH